MRSTQLQSAISWCLQAWLVAVGAWTICYHLALIAGINRTPTALLWICVSAILLLLLKGIDPKEETHRTAFLVPRNIRYLYLASAGLLAALVAIYRPVGSAFTLVWAAMLLLLIGAVLSSTRSTEATHHGQSPATSRSRIAFVIGLALASALLSAVAQRPDLDDVFLVNRSTHVESDAGNFAVRDTIFGDEILASPRPPNPQTSVESLIGTVAAALPINAASTTYLLWGPLISLLGVLALWTLLRTLGVPNAEYALALASAYLLLNGGVHGSFGNFGVVRSWQGKAALLVIVVPMLWHLGLRFGRMGHHKDLLLLALANIAAVGLSTSGIFISASVTGLALLAAVTIHPGALALRRLAIGLLAISYPLGATLMAAFAGAQDRTPRILGLAGAPNSIVASPSAEWPWYFVLGSGWGLGLAIFAILVAWLTLADRSARLALILAPIAVLAVFTGPGAIERIDSVLASDSILWRSIWIMPIPAAIGILLASPTLLPASRYRIAAIIMVPVIALGGLAITETNTLHPDNGVTITRPAWDIDHQDRVALEQIRALTDPGDMVASPESIGAAIAISTVDIRSVNPRGTTTASFRNIEQFHGELRLLLSWAVQFGVPDGRFQETRDSLSILGVDLVCIHPSLADRPISSIVAEEGYVNIVTDDECMYWRKIASTP